jgi:hypothetical protein
VPRHHPRLNDRRSAALMMLTLRTEPTDTTGLNGLGGVGVAWLDPMVGSHTEVHQATGMVLAQLRVGAAEALARMRARAFTEGRLLIDVARDVLARTLLFSEEMK